MTSSCTSMASEVFQWNGADVSNEGKQEKIKEELADVVNYCVLMADACGLDLDEIVWEKIKVNAKKYPVEKAKAYASAYEMMFAYYDLVMDEGIFIEEQTYVMLMNFFAHCEKILRINLNPENWKDMKWDEIIDNQINEENKITCHLRNKIRSC